MRLLAGDESLKEVPGRLVRVFLSACALLCSFHAYFQQEIVSSAVKMRRFSP